MVSKKTDAIQIGRELGQFPHAQPRVVTIVGKKRSMQISTVCIKKLNSFKFKLAITYCSKLAALTGPN